MNRPKNCSCRRDIENGRAYLNDLYVSFDASWSFASPSSIALRGGNWLSAIANIHSKPKGFDPRVEGW